MNTTSYWADTTRMPRFGKVDADCRVDVAIVGGGITGLSAAYQLQKAGCSVAVLERGRLGGFDSVNTTAHLTALTDLRLNELVQRFGHGGARRVWDAGQAAIDCIWKHVSEGEIDCDFKWVPAYFHLAAGKTSNEDHKSLSDDAQRATELKIESDFLTATPLVKKPGIRFAHQALFHPQKYLAGLAKLLKRRGSYIFEESEVAEIREKPMTLMVGNHKIRCSYVVIATHTPLTGNTPLVSATLFQTKLFLYTTYALSARVPASAAPEASFFDTNDPYYYLRVDRLNGETTAIYGGQDHKTGQVSNEATCYKKLETAFRRLFPKSRIDHCWSGQVVETADGLPYIGENAPHQFIATGFAGNGMTFGTLAGVMAVDAFLQRDNPWKELFDPHRKPASGGTIRFLRENKDYPYYFVRDRMARPAGRSVEVVRNGQGKIIQLNGRKVAAYREPSGKLHLLSPVCPHLQCIVNWNPAEKTWDCPCHGSRFSAVGEVLSGPAEDDLEKMDPATNGKRKCED